MQVSKIILPCTCNQNYLKMTLNEFVKATFDTAKYLPNQERYALRPSIRCKDGFHMSVQGSHGHYCKPKEHANQYTHMEIGYLKFPNTFEEELRLYAHYSDNRCLLSEATFANVPVELIQKIIDEHGGIDVDKTFSTDKP